MAKKTEAMLVPLPKDCDSAEVCVSVCPQRLSA